MNFSGDRSRLLDPTWYRVRYALTIRCMQIGESSQDSWIDESGWPKGIDGGKKKAWRRRFGSETQDLLLSLFKDQEAVPLPSARPEVSAQQVAEELLATTTEVLDDAGWHWVGRKPPRYLPWWRRFACRWSRVALRRRDERTIAGDRKLSGFLSDVVEPAAAIMCCAAQLAADREEYVHLKELVLERTRKGPRPLDRRYLDRSDVVGWSRSYLSTFLADQRLGSRADLRVGARLGRTRYRTPREPAPRVRYALACLLSRLAMEAQRLEADDDKDSFLSSAIAQLNGAFSDSPDARGSRLAQWAWLDPDLEALRAERKDEFATILARWGPAERRHIERRRIDSKKIAWAAYSEEEELLELGLTDGSRHQYFRVPKDVYSKIIVKDGSPDAVLDGEIDPGFASIRL